MSSVKITEEFIEKSIQTSDFLSGGLLQPAQQKSFVLLMKRLSTLLGRVRTVEMPQASMLIDKLRVSEPITRAAQEGNCVTTSPNKVKVNQIALNAIKVISDWCISTEVLQNSIEGNNFELTIMRAMTNQIAQDLELLAIMGDTDITGTDAISTLLKTNDGWYKKALRCHVLDAGGAEIQRGLFSEAKRMMPKQYRNDPNLRFMMSDSLTTDWQYLLAGGSPSVAQGGVGSDAVAAAAFGGGAAGMNPFGIPMFPVPLIPDDLPVPVAGATPAVIDGLAYGPYQIVVGSNNVLELNVNAGGAFQVTFAESKVYDLVELAYLINQAAVGAGAPLVAEDNGEGKLRLRTTTTGAASSIAISANPPSTANETLGFLTAGQNNTGAASNGTVPEGSFVIYTNPLNLVWGLLDATRIFAEFNKNCDQIETVVYNHVDAEIENPDSLVIITNVKRMNMVL